jgi:hypothetical protein
VIFTASHTIRAAYGSSFLAGTGLRAFQTGTFSSSSIVDQLTFKEMGLLSWLIIDVAIQWGGWAVAVLFKVGLLEGHARICTRLDWILRKHLCAHNGSEKINLLFTLS